MIPGNAPAGRQPRPSLRILGQKERRLLAEIYRHFEDSGEWPSAARLQRDIDRRRERLDVAKTSQSLTSELRGGFRRNGELHITLDGLSRLHAARPDLKAYVNLVRMAVAAYLTSDAPRITSKVVAEELGLTPLAVKRLLRILEFEPPFAGGTASPDGTAWEREVSPEVRHFRKVTSIAGYLRIKRRLEASPRPEVDDPGEISRWAGIESRLAVLRTKLPAASSVDDFQEIGLRTREIVAEAVELVTAADPPVAGVGSRDTKQRLRAYLRSRVAGATWARLEDVVRSVIALANSQTHDTRPHRAAAFTNVQAAATVIRVLQMIEAELGSGPSEKGPFA